MAFTLFVEYSVLFLPKLLSKYQFLQIWQCFLDYYVMEVVLGITYNNCTLLLLTPLS